MVAIPSRHRSLFLLAGVITLQVLLLAVQIKSESQGRLIRAWTVGAISPFERAGVNGVGGVRGIWNHYFALRNTTFENEKLKQENERLKLQLAQLQGKATEADRLADLLKFRQAHHEIPMLGARVIATGADAASQTIYLDRGENEGIKKNMGVITPDGVVGKVVETYKDTSQVLLITDKESGVGAMLANSRLHGPVGGLGEPLLALKYISNDDTVNPGEEVVTSGMDRIFPRDLPIGVVTEAKSAPTFKQIRVRPAANLERLEEVIVLLTLQPLELKKPADAAPAAPAANTATTPADKP